MCTGVHCNCDYNGYSLNTMCTGVGLHVHCKCDYDDTSVCKQYVYTCTLHTAHVTMMAHQSINNMCTGVHCKHDYDGSSVCTHYVYSRTLHT